MDLLTIAETAKLLKVSPMTIRRYIAAGRLPAVKVGKGIRIHKHAVEQLLAPIAPRPGVQDYDEKGGAMAERERPRRLTAEEQQRGLAVAARLKRLQEELLAKRGGKPFTPASWELLNEARDERSRAQS